MSDELPGPVAAYFEANKRFDLDAMLAPFAPDAVVVDEKRTYRGHDAIRAWIEEATLGARAVAIPRQVEGDGADRVVTAEVSGSFPGSPVTLGFRFGLTGDRIARLEIA
jgi:ketosteroid isomerase-like protein